ncbi:hypothetical protein BDW74DRAFT_173320 [Aspergillus multicolor]|uniref:fungal specific transcription factor domain-containing protein n=1 Tax=Aspergillus multicolor TaxID=41759 RepID=UPI003CCE0737
MQSGRRTKFCSPCLVNALLAISCFYVHVSQREHLSEPSSSRALQFYNEAKTLLDQEEGQVTLPSVQARCAIYLCAYGMGKQMLTWQYFSELTAIAKELTVRQETIVARAGDAAHEMVRALDRTIVGLFSLTSFTETVSLKQTLMLKPKFALLPEDHEVSDTWWPYPSTFTVATKRVHVHTNCVTNALFELQLIEWDFMSHCAVPHPRLPSPPTDPTTNIFLDRFRGWVLQLPTCIGLKADPTIPAIVDLQYHIAILSVFGRRGAVNQQNTNIESTLSDNNKDICRTSAHEVCRLINAYHSQWPIDSLPVTYIHYISVALLTLLDLVPEAKNTDPFIDLAMALRALGRRWQMAKANIRLILSRADFQGPSSAGKLSGS